MKPRIYKPDETDFSSNGLGVLVDCARCKVSEVSNGKYELELDYPLGTRFDEYFENDYQIKIKSNDQEEYHIFYIDDKAVDTFMDSVTIYAKSRTYRLGRRVVTTVGVDSKTAQEAMRLIENGIDKKSDIELYSDITTVSSTTFEARNVLNCVAGEQGSLLQYWGGEIKREPFKLSLLKRRGRDHVGTIRYGKDLAGLKMKLDWSGMKTRIIPYVDAQSADGTTNRIYGTSVDSEFINNYPDVYTEHIQFTEDQGAKDLKSLNNVAKNYFKLFNPGCDKPKISITIEFDKLTDSEEAKEFAKIRNYGLFDTFQVYHRKYDIYLESKVSSVVYDSLAEKTESLEAGDTQVAFYQQQANSFQEKLKEYATNTYMSGFTDYVSSMITGNGQAGGHVVLWPKVQPSNILIMDTDDVNTAQHVIRLNKNGIAFSKSGWNGPFNSAWTIDSVFNANFIKTGVLEGIDIHSKNENYDIYQHNGVMDFIDEVKNKKIGSVQANALRIANEDGTEAGLNIIQNEPYPLNFIVQRDNGSNERVVFIVPSGQDGKPILNIMAKTQIRNTLSVDELYVAGVKIDTNGGGSGGGTGGDGSTYSPINISSNITGNANIVAWLKKYTAEYGISEYIGLAYALIMVENGSTDGTDDIMQSSESAGYPGPGYLTGEASVKQGCKHLADVLKSSFAKGVDVWGAMQSYNFGTAYVGWLAGKGGKNTTDLAEQYSRDVVAPSLGNTTGATYSYVNAVSQADGRTYLYLNGGNFHYAAMIRQYVKVTEGGSGDYFMPIAKPITVTSEFGWRTSPITGEQELHNGIDLVNGNPNTPIYAADAGEVVIAGMYEAWYGNYVVIKHAGGLYTGYAHQSSLKVSVGQTVTKGQQIGNMGTTGPSTGEHLHFQFFTNGPWPTTTDFINPRTKMKF
ncbi:phage tail spike protein [Enterococcus massiliensis]|uniref:phage tail spike protein n=1 Tax=Enterococcus massiliensis TaxID=1640685 RepID=UPI00065DCB4B|nr:phage tail spike protein [Enterococcus massiliensis]